MFILGLLVGRGTAPIRFDIVRLQDELAVRKAAFVEKTAQRYKVAFEKNLDFHEKLKDDETELPVATIPAPAASPKSVPEVPEKTEATIPKKLKDSEFQKPATATSSDTWVIQVAATQKEAQGKQLVKRLAKSGYSAYIVKASIDGKGTWYRIRLGGYTSRKAAEVDLSKLKKEQFSPIIINP